jgi:formate hydrogenlyase subunit 3/multisubunit Na+/H+ antiporter MnhD subunit
MLNNIQLILPAVILGGGAFVLFVIARLCKLSNKQEALCAVLLLVISLVVMVLGLDDVQKMINDPDSFFGVADAGGIRYYPNAIGVFVLMVGIIVGIMVILYSGEYLSKDPRYMLYYPLILLILAGLMGMFMSANLFNLFLLVEFITVTASALIAFRFYQEIAIKAGFKYLIMSSIGTMLMLLGVYYVFRSTGTMDLDLVFISADPFTKIGGASFLLGFSLKAGVVPLHTWVPDVYGHAPSAVSGLLAGVISKSMLFMMPLICLKLGIQSKELGAYLMIFACLNMLIGSIRMLRQVLLRRFLSFSTIAQTGYLMFAMGIGLYYDLDQAITASLYLFLVIAVMKSLAFLSAGIFEFHLGSQNIDQVSGVGLVLPFPALCFSISLAGLAGIPLLAGFNGKWLVFTAAFATNDVFALSILVIFLASSVIGLGGYLPIIVKQYYRSRHSMIDLDQFPKQFKVSNWILIPVSILTILVIGIGIYPTPWITLIEKIMVWMKV